MTTIPTWLSPPTRAPPPSPTSPTGRRSYGFWLDDAFASGGSAGYDHKVMGITAKGAWESVKRHFRELGRTSRASRSRSSASATCRATCSATACCCPDHIRLVAAFDHRHIFLDPDPDPATRFAERERLFAPAALVLGRLRPGADQQRRRRLPAHRQDDRDHARDAGGARHRGRAAAAGRADARDAQGAGRPALERRHRHLRQGRSREPRRGRRPRQRRDAGRWRGSALQGGGRGRNLGFTQRGPDRYAANRRPHQHRLHRQLGRRRLLRPRGQHQDPAGRVVPRRTDPEAARRAAGRDDRRGRPLVLRDNYLQTQALEHRPGAGGAVWTRSWPLCASSSGRAGSTGRSSSCPATRSWPSAGRPAGG